jgi:Flp pilus assembly protein TadG
MPDVRRASTARACACGGQALVELALALTVLLVLLGGTYTGWAAMHQSVQLTSAARAGAIVAANDLQGHPAMPSCQVLTDATAAVNAEQGASSTYRPSGSGCSGTCGSDCVTLSTTTGPLSASAGITEDLVTITVTGGIAAQIPVVPGIRVSGAATARY